MLPEKLNFEEKPVRIIMIEEKPWFVAADVFDILGLSKGTNAHFSALDDEEKGSSTITTPGGPQKMNIVNESGLYGLTFRSRKPEAKKFRKWVTSEVLPSIRRTGAYLNPSMTSEQLQAAFDKISEMAAMNKQLEIERDGWQNLAIQQGEVASSWMAMVQHGEISDRNGLPRMLKRRGTFVADPRGKNSADMNQLQLTFKLI